jgi:hypothetical protein
MPKRIIKPENELAWGLLVKSWATGKNYFSPGTPAPPMPKTRQEFVQICSAFGISLDDLPDWVTGVIFIQPSKECLAIRLPPKELVEQSEQEFDQQNALYPLPAFYDEFYAAFGSPLRVPQDRKHEFHAKRIGDYSISMCA